MITARNNIKHRNIEASFELVETEEPLFHGHLSFVVSAARFVKFTEEAVEEPRLRC